MQISFDRHRESVANRMATKPTPRSGTDEPQDQIKLWERVTADSAQGFGNLASAFKTTGWPTVLAAAPSSLLGYVSPNLAYVNLVAAGAGALLTGGLAVAGLTKEARELDKACQEGATHTTGKLGNGNRVQISMRTAKQSNSKATTFSKAIAISGATTLVAGAAAVAGLMSPALAVLAPVMGVAVAIPRAAKALQPGKLRDFASSVKRKFSSTKNYGQFSKSVDKALRDVERQHPSHFGKWKPGEPGGFYSWAKQAVKNLVTGRGDKSAARRALEQGLEKATAEGTPGIDIFKREMDILLEKERIGLAKHELGTEQGRRIAQDPRISARLGIANPEQMPTKLKESFLKDSGERTPRDKEISRTWQAAQTVHRAEDMLGREELELYSKIPEGSRLITGEQAYLTGVYDPEAAKEILAAYDFLNTPSKNLEI